MAFDYSASCGSGGAADLGSDGFCVHRRPGVDADQRAAEPQRPATGALRLGPAFPTGPASRGGRVS